MDTVELINIIFHSLKIGETELNLVWIKYIFSSFKDKFRLILSIYESIKDRFNSNQIGINKLNLSSIINRKV